MIRAAACLIACAYLSAADPSSAPHRTYGQWHSSVIGGGGFLQHLVWAPSDAQRVYLSSDVGGCWRSDDAGATWRMLHGSLPVDAASYSISALVVDPRDADRVYIAADNGVWRSTDAGRSWRQVLKTRFAGNGSYRSDGRLLVIDAQRPDTIHAAAIGDGYQASTDGGETWTRSGPERLYPTDLHQDARDPQRLWLSSRGGKGPWIDGKQPELVAGLFVSDDRGATWRRLSETGMREIVQDPTAPDALIALTPGPERVVRSTDDGRTWARFDAGLAPAKSDPRSDGSYGALATGPDFTLLGGNGGSFYRLGKGETAWSKVAWKRDDVDEGDWWGALKRPTHWHFGSSLGWLAVDPHDPAHWAFTDWYALYQSRTAGRSWKLTIDGIEMVVVHTVVQDPGDPQRVHVGVADVGYFRSGDGGSTFAQIDHGISNNIKHIAVCIGTPSRVYAVGPQRWEWQANQVFRSDDGGATWKRPAMRGLPAMADRRCNTVVVHPAKPDEAYLVLNGAVAPGEGGVWRSTDAGDSWTWIGQGLPAGEKLFRTDIWVAGPELAVSADGSLVAGSDDLGRLFRFDPAVAAWSEVGHLAGGVNAVLADPRTAGRFWHCRKEGGLWRSDDGGATWKRACESNAWAVAVDAADPRRIALNGTAGILLSRDGGATWTALDASLPYRHLRNVLAFAGDRLVVGTGGNGVFWIDVPR